MDPIFLTQGSNIILSNPATERIIGYSAQELNDLQFIDLIHPEDRGLVMEMRRRRLSREDAYSDFTHWAITKAGDPVHSVHIEWESSPTTLVFVRDVTGKNRMEIEKEKHMEQLHKALNEIKTLRGILPICSYCKKIRDDKGYWEQVEVYINKYSDVDFSHSICPECMKKNSHRNI